MHLVSVFLIAAQVRPQETLFVKQPRHDDRHQEGKAKNRSYHQVAHCSSFTGYNAFQYFRPRWGDYGAAMTDGSSIWIASEYIGQTCTYAQ